MNLIQLGEEHPVYKQIEGANGNRHYHFLSSMIAAAIATDRLWVAESLIKAINFHAIVGLHPEAGQYRSVPVVAGEYNPPPPYRVAPLMEDFVNSVNRRWETADITNLAAYALWAINHIHPFINGNGRTARAACYFIICVKSGGLLPGSTIVPEILRTEPLRSEYVDALRLGDQGDLTTLVEVIAVAIDAQLQTVDNPGE